MSLALFTDDLFLQHDTGAMHPENSRRLEAIAEKLGKKSYYGQINQLARRFATHEEVMLVHAAGQVEQVKASSQSGGGYLDADTVVSEKSYEAALLAAGSGLEAADRVMAGDFEKATLLLRPPGHHSLAHKSMGFCLFNNIAICARYLQQKHNLEKVAIIDWDVHHGNGTEAIFYDDPSVLFISSHQYPFYPGTGAASDTGTGPGEGYTLNLPVAAGADDQLFENLFDNQVIPRVEDFQPEIILVSAGFDAHRQDPLASLNLGTEAFAMMSKKITDLAERLCQKKVISFLEGGYNLAALADSVEAHVSVMKG